MAVAWNAFQNGLVILYPVSEPVQVSLSTVTREGEGLNYSGAKTNVA